MKINKCNELKKNVYSLGQLSDCIYFVLRHFCENFIFKRYVWFTWFKCV